MYADAHLPTNEHSDLSSEELQLFWRDVAVLGRTISAIFAPVKLDNLVMGHLCPHVHCHVYPQYATDDPHALINIREGASRLTERERNQSLSVMGDHLAFHYLQ